MEENYVREGTINSGFKEIYEGKIIELLNNDEVLVSFGKGVEEWKQIYPGNYFKCSRLKLGDKVYYDVNSRTFSKELEEEDIIFADDGLAIKIESLII